MIDRPISITSVRTEPQAITSTPHVCTNFFAITSNFFPITSVRARRFIAPHRHGGYRSAIYLRANFLEHGGYDGGRRTELIGMLYTSVPTFWSMEVIDGGRCTELIGLLYTSVTTFWSIEVIDGGRHGGYRW